jgi:iron complex outermembrane receptor protein
VGLETLVDEERFASPELINRATGQSVADSGLVNNVRLTNVGAFLSSNYQVVDQWLKLTGGLRYDRHSQYGDQVTGRLGATSRWSQELVAKLLYGSAFKAPSPYLLYAEPLTVGDVVGNEALKPQRIHTAEYQMVYRPSAFLGISSGVAYSWLLDKAEFTPQGINQTARNIAGQRSLSWESTVDLRYYELYSAYAGVELVHSQRDLGQEGFVADTVGSENVVYPPWIIRAGGTIDVPSLPSVPLELGTQWTAVGPRRAADTSLVQAGQELRFEPYVVVDLFLSTRALYLLPGHESRASLRARNLLAERGPNPGFSGFEYPLPSGEIFLQFMHEY